MAKMTQTVKMRVADDAFFTRSQSGAIWGRVYFEFADGSFPDSGWTDLVAGFSTSWLDALTRIATGTATQERVWFMDGPFAIDISATDHGPLRLILLHKELQKHLVDANVRDLLANAIEAGKQVIAACRKRGWTDKDVSDLAEAIRRGVEALRT